MLPSSSGESSQTSDYGSGTQADGSFDNELFGYFNAENGIGLIDSLPL